MYETEQITLLAPPFIQAVAPITLRPSGIVKLICLLLFPVGISVALYLIGNA